MLSSTIEYEDDFEYEVNWKSIEYKDILLEDQIGGGGVGIVYKGWFNKKPIAIKTLFDNRLNEDLRKEFMNELSVMSTLDHPNIVKLIGACLKPPNLCLVMELCEYSLYEMLHKMNRKIKINQVLKIMIDIALAMEYLHSKYPVILHRDIKSQNILVFKSRNIQENEFNSFTFKLCDFGLVNSTITTAGTPNYMPPELLKNESFSKKVDVYMFGILFWEVIAQEIPFQGYNTLEISRKVIGGERPNFNSFDCPICCQELIKNCWSSDPKLRPEFTEIVKELQMISMKIPIRSQVEITQEDDDDALDKLLH